MREQLVEGHTVFAVLEVIDKTTTVRAEFAAAVAVLVRENVQNIEVNRFPGVLWFNDQYLTNPTATPVVRQVRHPCGGAVLAVQAGDSDPRVTTGDFPLIGMGNPGSDDLSNDAVNGSMPPGQVANPDDYNNDYSWLNTGGTPPYSDIPTGTMGYRESYLITDPNDHMWQIDVYTRYTRLSTNLLSDVRVNSTVWVVNILGSPVFTPDEGDNCPPFVDIASVYNTIDQTAGGALPNYTAIPGNRGTFGNPVTGGAYQDNPPAGYMQPDANSAYCYNGNPVSGNPADPCPPSPADCDGPCYPAAEPVRMYNALLYFRLQDFRASSFDAPKYHGASTDTNGCQVGTEWQCPAGDNSEGNSHPFRPSQPATGTAMVCPKEYGGPNDSNHGGSTSPTYDCDWSHATVNIDIYFSGAGRPFPPVVPNFVVRDTQGSAAPFHYHP